jgi:hypothetical protein
MSLDLARIKDLLHVANESAKHAGALSGIHAEAMNELTKIHDDLTKERIENALRKAASKPRRQL